ncbi:MAG: PRC-barrel domain-containing protein [Bacteroidota bacterium]|nr:PRC-barrel domain-containing protein [Bacteroidota bacterium]
METFTAENFTGVLKEDLRINRPIKFLAAKSVIGNKVHDNKGEDLGKIEDVIIDVETDKIYFIIQFAELLILNKKYFAIPFRLFDIDHDKKQFILYQSKEILEKAPGFDMNHWPETNFHEEEIYWSFL